MARLLQNGWAFLLGKLCLNYYHGYTLAKACCVILFNPRPKGLG